MKKEIIENIKNSLPSAIKNFVDHFKQNFDENGSKLLDNTGGTIGVLVQLLGKPLIDNYFKNIEDKKLENFGSDTYLKGGLTQANSSLSKIINELPQELSPEAVINILESELIDLANNISKKEMISVLHPKYHPIIELIKNSYVEVISKLCKNDLVIKSFLKDFNENIQDTIINAFGKEIYNLHVEQTANERLKEQETSLLWSNIELNKIGFKENEDLMFIETFGEWKLTESLNNKNSIGIDDTTNENNLIPVTKLVEEYFEIHKENCLENILFIVSDFGKGKSSFMRHLAAYLSKRYLETSEGYFPIYFNLRNFSQYTSDTKLGVISDYLETQFAYKIDSDENKSKKYFFLIDSLDESGDLNKSSIENVVNSVKRIQLLDKVNCRNNKIIITTRPFDELKSQLANHKPYLIDEFGKEKTCFLSIYGFKKDQFNSWIQDSIKKNITLNSKLIESKFINDIMNDSSFDLYEDLTKETLTKSELRRPIFAYMIYQLIVNNIDFKSFGKIGVYLSFVNLLSKDAKYLHDPAYKVKLLEQIKFRNILHTISTLWMYQKHYGKQGILNKADVIRLLEDKGNEESDNVLLERHKNSKISSIQFLSHSYFGENETAMHFQHQSFAEILFAEYILKIFLKFGFDQAPNIELAALKLEFGEPTFQIINFYKDLISLLKTTVEIPGEDKSQLQERRKLMFPIVASIAIPDYNNQQSKELYYEWFEKGKINDETQEIPEILLNEWFLDNKIIDRITNFAKNLCEVNNNILFSKSTQNTSIFKNDLTILNQKLSSTTFNYHKWYSLILGNLLYNTDNQFFLGKVKDYTKIFELISHTRNLPEWSKDLFKGLDMRECNTPIDLSYTLLYSIDFSNSYIKNLVLADSNLNNAKFENCTINSLDLSSSSIFGTSFDGLIIEKDGILKIELAQIQQGVPIPYTIARKFHNVNKSNMNVSFIGILTNSGSDYSNLSIEDDNRNQFNVFKTIKPLIAILKEQNKLTKEESKKLFNIIGAETYKKYITILNEIYDG